MYSLKLHRERVIDYLRNLQTLSRQARLRLFANLHGDLRVHADAYRNEADRRVSPGSDCFWYHIVLRDGSGPLRRFSFIVNDAPAVYGVLLVEYVEES